MENRSPVNSSQSRMIGSVTAQRPADHQSGGQEAGLDNDRQESSNQMWYH